MAVASPVLATDHVDCPVDGIKRVLVPVDYGIEGGPVFELAYRLREGEKALGPTVIVIPGGPGGTPIEDDTSVNSGAIPARYRAIVTDPRGAGCNDDPALTTNRDFSSEFLARDTLKVIADLEREDGRQLDYVLFAQSYGTLVATIAANLAPRLGLTPPRALVFEGTIGHSFASYVEYFSSFQSEWQYVRDELPANWRSAFMEHRFPAPLPLFAAAWASLIQNDLLLGYGPDGQHELNWQVSAGGQWELMSSVSSFARALLQREAAVGSGQLLRVIACTELFGHLIKGRDLQNGELVLAGPDTCEPGEKRVAPFDSADWQVGSPIVYFQGEHDPATTLAQAHYHFENQTRASLYFVSVDRAAHAVLSRTLNVGHCPDRLWGAITTNLSQLVGAVAYCDTLEQRAHVRLEIKAASPDPMLPKRTEKRRTRGEDLYPTEAQGPAIGLGGADEAQ